MLVNLGKITIERGVAATSGWGSVANTEYFGNPGRPRALANANRRDRHGQSRPWGARFFGAPRPVERGDGPWCFPFGHG